MRLKKWVGLGAVVIVVAAMFVFVLPVLAAEYTIKVGTITAESHPDCILMNEVFKKYVEEQSEGRIKVELYPNAQLGGDREMAEAVQVGILQIALPVVSVTSSFEKSFNVVEMPYLFTTRESAFKALDGDLGQELDRRLLKTGMMNLGYYENGFRHITNNKGPIHSPADLKGVKIRTMEVPPHITFFKKLGANPTPMSFGELYTALQQGTVDAQENPLAIINESRLYEVQKYISLTGHVFSVTHVLTNKTFIDNLPSDLQEVVKEGARRFIARHREYMPELEEKLIGELQGKGVKINELTPEQKKPFVEIAHSIYGEFKNEIGEDILSLAEEIAK